MMQVVPAIVFVAVMLIGGDWVGDTADEADALRARQGQALSIAMQQVATAMTVDFDRLQPTADFEPVSIHDPARGSDHPGDAAGEGEPAYAVEMRITPLDSLGRVRKVEVRVGYAVPDGERIWVETATVRQDWNTAQAKQRHSGNSTHG